MILVWVVLAVAGALTASQTTSRLDKSFEFPGPATEADAAIAAAYGHGVTDPLVPVITLPQGERVDDPGARARLRLAFAAAGQAAPHVRVVDRATTGREVFASDDGRSAYALVSVPGRDEQRAQLVDPVRRAVSGAAPAGWRVRVTGVDALTSGQTSGGGAGVLVESLLGAVGAVVVLAFVFGSFLALLPLVVAGVSILTTFLAVLGLTGLTDINFVVQYLIALIGLGVAIDYSLLVATRWREERARGAENTAAVHTAMARAGRAVVFSGITVGIGLLALVVLPVPFLRSIGIAGALIPLISVLVAVTLLPILLATVGPRLDWPRRRTDRTASPAWTRWARLTFRRRVLAALVGVAALAVLIAPALSLQVGQPRSGALAQSGPAHEALSTLRQGGVPAGVLTPTAVLTTQPSAGRIADRLRTVPGVHAVVSGSSTAAGLGRSQRTALLTVLPIAQSSQPAGRATVQRIRDAVAHRRGVVGVAGSGAEALDFSADVYGNFGWLLALIAVATFVLLARAFRSLLLAAKAVVLNLASLGAAYGVLTFVWQQGHGSSAVWGVPAAGAITEWVPLMVFAFLFGLSMDYEVFILARMREAYDRGGSTQEAVITGLGRTGRLVSSAALILVLSFLAMSTAPDTQIKILATGLGAGILIDATIVRCLLVPALVSLFGRYNWWLPAPAARLLRVRPSALPALARP